MFKYYGISFFLVTFLFGFISALIGVGLFFFNSCFSLSNNYFVFDSVSFYLIFLVVLLGVYSVCSFFTNLSLTCLCFLSISLLFSCLCFCVNHCILFWCFYELSMLPLLYLIFKESPYSERFIAAWYFACYLLVTSLPLLLLFVYISYMNESVFFDCWGSVCNIDLLLFVLLSFIFFTKVPLMPFHTWLPIVHAEATSIVSIFLSGYIMKLGLLGVYRCCSFIFDHNMFFYLFLCCLFSVFFFVTASLELDGKRWLAFISLSHIVVPFMGFFVSGFSLLNFCFFYCLAHGLSAGLVFAILWMFYDLSNSRNWLLLKSSVNSSLCMIFLIFSMLSLSSFPTTAQFFCEVEFVSASTGLYLYLLFWCFYLFLGGLVPLILCGHLLIRTEFLESYSYSSFYFLNFVFYMCFWCYAALLFI